MRRSLFLCGVLLLAIGGLVACGPATLEQTVNYENDLFRLAHPSDWAVEASDGGVIIGSDRATVDGLQNNESVTGGAVAVSTVPTAQLATTDPLELIDILLQNFVSPNDAAWSVAEPPTSLTINEVPSARLTLVNRSPGNEGLMALATIMGDETTMLLVLLDTTDEGVYDTTLNEIFGSIVLLAPDSR